MQGNAVDFEGNLTADPELVTAANGTEYVRFSLARSFKRNDQDHTTFVDFVAFGPLARNLAETGTKGMRLEVTGNLNQARWETSDGRKASKLEVIAESVNVSLRWATAVVEKNARPDTPTDAPALELVASDGELVEAL